MVGTSDIPDWCHVESGTSELSPETSAKMFSISPIAHVSGVKAPVLFLLGDQDRRVPMSQGLSYYQVLKAKGVRSKVLNSVASHVILSVHRQSF